MLLVVGCVAVIGITFMAIASFVVRNLGRPNFREFQINSQVYFAGWLGRGNGATSYFSVRAEGPSESALTAEANLVLHVDGMAYAVHDITPRTVDEIGQRLQVRSPIHRTVGFIGWGEQNRDGGIEFTFVHGKLSHFYARWHRRIPSPFALGANGESAVTFPATEEQLLEAFGKPIARRDQVIH
jgi:hypothetical protein